MNNSYFIKSLCLILTVGIFSICQSQELIKDVNLIGNNGTSPDSYYNRKGVMFNNTFYFEAAGGQYESLWKTDGTAGGTVLVKEITGLPHDFVVVNGTIYFVGGSNTIWKSNGTATGTTAVVSHTYNIYESVEPMASTNNPNSRFLFPIGNSIYYFIENLESGYAYQLWKYDAITSTNSMVRDFGNNYIGNARVLNNKLIFTTNLQSDLWVSDGTNAGTVLLKTSANIKEALVINGTYYFITQNSFNDNSLWKSDGTIGGTISVKTFTVPLRDLVNFNGTLYFAASTIANNDLDLWKSDGTTAGTVLVKGNIHLYSTQTSLKNNFAVFNNHLYFVAGDFNVGGGVILWKTDGTTIGTTQVYRADNEITQLIAGTNTLFFVSFVYQVGKEVWKSDGTTAGTSILKDINLGVGDSAPIDFVKFGNKVIFKAKNDILGYEYWITDGTVNGTQLLKDIGVGNKGSNPTNLSVINNRLVFTANDEKNFGDELWVSDGTVNGTTILKDINVGSESSLPNNFFTFNNTLYFQALNPDTGYEIWKTDGTPIGTQILKDINIGTGYSYPSAFYPTNNNLLFFTVNNGTNGTELWKSDGTSAGTAMVKDIKVGTAGTDPFGMSVAGDEVYFFGYCPTSYNTCLYKTDGTSEGTQTLLSGSMYNSTTGVAVGTSFYFVGYNATTGQELWRSGGTSVTTALFKDIRTGSQDSYIINLTNVNGSLYFSATNGVNGQELWKSDGTPTGTVMVKDINLTGNANPHNFTNLNGILIFTATDDSGERKIWRSDGTDAGTYVILNATDIVSIKVEGDLYYFSAVLPNQPRQIFQTNGTVAGTILAAESAVFQFDGKKLGGKLFKSYYTENTGFELYSFDVCPEIVTLANPTDNVISGNRTTQASAINGKIQASNYITGTAKVTYQAKSIELNPNFKAENGTVFKAEVGGCN